MYGGGIVIVGIAVMHEHLYCIVLMIVSAVYIISVIAEQLDWVCHHDNQCSNEVCMLCQRWRRKQLNHYEYLSTCILQLK